MIFFNPIEKKPCILVEISKLFITPFELIIFYLDSIFLRLDSILITGT